MPLILLLILLTTALECAPSSLFWTTCTTSIYDTGNGHVDENVFFTIFDKKGSQPFLPPDTGFEVGILTWGNLKAEIGFDYIGGTNNPFFFNAGAAIAEDKLFKHAPAFKLGFFDFGTKTRGSHRTNQNTINFIFGKTVPVIGGTFCAAFYSGSSALGRDRRGFMVSYERDFCKTTYCDGKEYSKWEIYLDYASGKNAIGGGGAAVVYYFTPDISLLTGPIWFNSREIYGSWKWSIQAAISFPLFDPKLMSW